MSKIEEINEVEEIEVEEKYFEDLSLEEKFEVVCSIEPVKEMLDRYVYNSEFEGYMMEKVHDLKDVTYELGICCYLYLEIKGRYGSVERGDCITFLNSLEDVVKCYGASNRCEKQMAKCQKLRESNLFVHECKRLCQMYYEDDIKPSIDYVEDFGYSIYCKTMKPEDADMFECFLDNYSHEVNSIYWNEVEECWEYSRTIKYKAA